MIGTLYSKDKAHWKGFAQTLTHVYNCMKSKVMFGHKPKILVGFKMGLSSPKTFKRSHYQCINALQDMLALAYDFAMKAQEKEAKRLKERYDYQAHSGKFGAWLPCDGTEKEIPWQA